MQKSSFTLGARLVLARKMVVVDGRPLSARRLAKVAGLTPTHVRALETSAISSPAIVTVEKLAAVLGLSTDWLIRGLDPAPEPAAVQAAFDTARRMAAAAGPSRPVRPSSASSPAADVDEPSASAATPRSAA